MGIASKELVVRKSRFCLWLMLLMVATEGKSQGCLKDSLIDDFVNGKLVLVNQMSLINTNDAFFNKLLSLDFTACEVIGEDKGRELYGTMGGKGVVSITLFDVEPLRGQYVDLVDASILKYFNDEIEMFYHTDGIPHQDMYSALNALVNKKIEKVDVIQKEEAMAIWGKQARNGAIMITCDRMKLLTLFDP